ncbi:MAG: glycine cleavage system protein GcvH [Saprospiraceae bacterium]|nr:glycine cleavage system protein GcvH [Saprospiraceae bacterium]
MGVTDFAQSELGEIVYVEVDTVGDTISKDEIFGTVEAVKTTSDLFMPISGVILEFNKKLDENEGDDPGLINSDPYGEGWIVKIKISDESEIDHLMNAEQYSEAIS